MTRDRDEVIRSAMRELRAADACEAPAFAAVLEPRHRRRTFDAWTFVGMAVAASALIAAGVDATLRIQAWRTRLVVPTEVRELSAWRPMTDVLLQTPNAGILIQPPGMDQSLLPINPILEDDQ
ncbi:MAG: hypothetical protein ACRENU_07795 [Gemmatimonadaceae bacterium]